MILVWLTSFFAFLLPIDSMKEKEVTKQCLVSSLKWFSQAHIENGCSQGFGEKKGSLEGHLR